MIRAFRQDILLALVGVGMGAGLLHHTAPLPIAKQLLRLLSIG